MPRSVSRSGSLRFLLAILALASIRLVDAAPANWQTHPGFRSRALPVLPTGKTGFTRVASGPAGILFSNSLPQSISITNQILLDGSGVAAGDVDGDGWCDLYFCAIDGRNALYRNLGDWRFEDITEKSGTSCAGLRSTGVALADLDGDGDLDLIVNTAGNGTLLFRNDGQGRFAPFSAVVNQSRGGKSLALADFDGDGWLDVYVVNYRASALMDMLDARFTFKVENGKRTVATFNGRPTSDPELAGRFAIGPRGEFQENGEPDVLYRNDRGTNFTAVSFTSGSFLDEDGKPLEKPPLDWGLSAAFRDINGDGLPDLHVCNDFHSPDRFWINQGGGKFRLSPRLAQRHSSVSSMSVDFADFNRDGFDDFFVLDMMSRNHSDRMRFLTASYFLSHPPGYFEDRPQYELNTLFLNRGDGSFAEISQLSGLEAAEWAWSCIFLDVDLDGWEDILVAAGMERDGRDLDVAALLKAMRASGKPSDAEVLRARSMYPKHADGTLAFRNRRDLTFEEVSRAWGFDAKGVCSAMALADLDNDGDMDVVVNSLNDPVLLFRNDSPAPRIAVRLKGQPANTRGVGARISVSGGPVAVQTQEMISGSRYLACDDAMRVFAAGNATSGLAVEVNWRSGRRSIITNALPNHLYELDEAAAVEVPPAEMALRAKATKPPQPLFEDVSDRLGHIHRQEQFDDFARQPLLPNRLSQLGPGVAWFDLDSDGREDLVIGGAVGGEIAVFHNGGTNGFQKQTEPLFSQPLKRTQTGIVGWRASTNAVFLLAGSSSYEDGQENGPSLRQYDLIQSRIDDGLAGQAASTGPIALADLYGTNSAVLLVGSRVVPGRYPEPASSHLYRYAEGQWQLDVENSRVLENAGLVSGAIFSDLNDDGYPELVLACEWGPILVFRNDQGRLTEWLVPVTFAPPITNSSISSLRQLNGWWNSVITADFDGDGRMDIAAGNWGRNTKYEAHRAWPLSIYYGDFGGDGALQILEAYYDPVLRKTVPARQLNSLARGMPWIRGQFTSYRDFSEASVEQVFGDRISAAKTLQVGWLESVVMLNRGDHFEVRILPVEAQMAPVFGICAGDFDGDGNEDLVLAQNFFATQPETPRYDAGRGLLLLGDGKGGFQPLSGDESGIKIYGEQRGAAVADFDGDGRVDIAVSQNGAATKLYRNKAGKPGLRVRLRGPAGNLQALGSVVRVRSATKLSSSREVHGGGGYWSQDSAVQVFAGVPSPREIEVRWPGGKVTKSAVPEGAIEVEVDSSGGTLVIRSKNP